MKNTKEITFLLCKLSQFRIQPDIIFHFSGRLVIDGLRLHLKTLERILEWGETTGEAWTSYSLLLLISSGTSRLTSHGPGILNVNMIFQSVQVILLLLHGNQSLKQGVNLTSLEIVTDPAQEEEVPLIEFPQLESVSRLTVGSHLEAQQGPPDSRVEELSQAVEEGQGGEGEEGEPPPPEEQEVVLVEQIVGEDAQDALHVGVASASSFLHPTGHLSREDVAEGVDSSWCLLVVVVVVSPVIPEMSS